MKYSLSVHTFFVPLHKVTPHISIVRTSFHYVRWLPLQRIGRTAMRFSSQYNNSIHNGINI